MITNYDNPLRRQCFDIPALAIPQFEASSASFKALLNNEKIASIKKIIITGCGDSYLAAVQAKPAFEKYLAGTGCEMQCARAIDVARYTPLAGNAQSTMIVAISASGGPARIAEILERGKKHGCLTMALTNTATSRAATTADYTYLTNTPAFPDAMPGLRNYFASLVSLFVMAAMLHEKKSGQAGALAKLREELYEYNTSFAPVLEKIDSTAFEAASEWKSLKGFEATADGPLFACAEFVAAKYAEASGDMCTVIDSENYCHVNTFIRPKAAIGTHALALSSNANMPRIAATVNLQVQRDLRSVLFVADKPAAALGISENVHECVLPAPNAGFEFLYLLYAYIPSSIAASYHSAFINEPYFRDGGPFFDPAINTLKTNQIRVI